MTLFDHQYDVFPDLNAGVHGVYSSHVKYTTLRSSPFDVDFWASFDWLGEPYPEKLRLFFRSSEVRPPIAAWDWLLLRLRLAGETRREYHTPPEKAGGTLVTGVYVDAVSLPDPPPERLVLWVLGRRQA